jgi:hypothetical protein
MVRVARVGASVSLFRLSSIADPAQPVEPHETVLIIYTITRSAEVLLTVRLYGRAQFVAILPWCQPERISVDLRAAASAVGS